MKTTAQKLAEKYMRCMIEMWEEADKNIFQEHFDLYAARQGIQIIELIFQRSVAGEIDWKGLEKYAREYQAVTEAPDEAELHEAELANQVAAPKYMCKCGEARETYEDLMTHYAYAHEG